MSACLPVSPCSCLFFSILYAINQCWKVYKISPKKLCTLLGSKIVCEYADGTNTDTSFGLNEAFGDWIYNTKIICIVIR